MDSDLLKVVNDSREKEIELHYDAAKEELKALILKAPLQQVFYLYSGCPNLETAKLVAALFTADGCRAEAKVWGYSLFKTVYIECTVDLPTSLQV